MPVATYDDVLAIERVPLARAQHSRRHLCDAEGRRGDRAGRAGAHVSSLRRAASRTRRSGRIGSSSGASPRPAICSAALESSATTRSPSCCRTCRKRTWRYGAGRPRASPSPSTRFRRRRRLAGLLKAVEPKASRDARADAGDGSLAEGDKSGRGADGTARGACRRPGALRLPEKALSSRAASRLETRSRSRSRFSIFAPNWRRSGATPSISAAPKPTRSRSYFCTGGTTGAPKIARRTHFSEASTAGR